MDRVAVNQAVHATTVRMLGVLPYLTIERTSSYIYFGVQFLLYSADIPAKALLGLCNLVLFPANYHYDTVFPDASAIQEANRWLMDSGKLGKEGVFYSRSFMYILITPSY